MLFSDDFVFLMLLLLFPSNKEEEESIEKSPNDPKEEVEVGTLASSVSWAMWLSHSETMLEEDMMMMIERKRTSNRARK